MCYYPFFPGSDLPDDDYTTLVPRTKTTNPLLTKTSSPIPIIVSNNEKYARTKRVKSTIENAGEKQKVTITGITRRCSTIDQDSLDQSRSAPSSPAQSRPIKRRSSNARVPLGPIESDSKSMSSEIANVATNGPTTTLSSGSLEIRLKFDAKNNKMWLFILKATLELSRQVSKQTLVQIHLTVLPNKRIRFRTRAKPIDNAMFAEEFLCKVSPEAIEQQGIRFRLYTSERFKREKLLAEATLIFGSVNLDEDMSKIVPFDRVFSSEESDLASRSRTCSLSTSRQDSIVSQINDGRFDSPLPQLEIGLAYDRIQSMFTLEIGKGANFITSSSSRAPDTYVQISLCNATGEDIVTNRTGTRHGQHHPIYAERYPFNIQENLLNQISFLISVINNKPSGKNDRDFGCISFGHNTSGKAQSNHWEQMLNNQGETVTQWHILSEKTRRSP